MPTFGCFNKSHILTGVVNIVTHGRLSSFQCIVKAIQLYQSQRAVIDARDRAGKAVAGQIELEIARALTKAGV